MRFVFSVDRTTGKRRHYSTVLFPCLMKDGPEVELADGDARGRERVAARDDELLEHRVVFRKRLRPHRLVVLRAVAELFELRHRALGEILRWRRRGAMRRALGQHNGRERRVI
eukprot:31445-Pelagococcus_subviridis.AAC.18